MRRKLWRMDVKVKIVNKNIVQVFTMEDELFCSFILPRETAKFTYPVMATRIEHLFYDDIKSADRIEVISYVVKHCMREGFVPHLFFENEDTHQNIGTLIREARLKRGLAAKDVAMLVGIAAPNYSHIENGQTSPTYKTLLRIFDVLDIHLNIQPETPAPINVEERAEAEREKEAEAERKRLVAQVREDYPYMLHWSREHVMKSPQYKKLLNETSNHE